ncbi:low molecular weight phosphotyrosine protein phosphatase [Streptomyces sp. NPDC057621]|uniref:arsenate reductase/protein-tyrosine-phosphatase family protein n=1 Tax=Streptomyces sp. NPDC057621 TaxID=3346186 RepID=UPI003698C2E3
MQELRNAGSLPVGLGLRDKWAGGPAHEEMFRLAAARGYDLTGHRATQVAPELMAWADLVLAMDRAVLDELRTLSSPDIGTPSLYLGEGDVPDPYRGDEQAFRACADLIEAAASQHLP